MRRYRHGRGAPTFDTPIIMRRAVPDADREAGRVSELAQYRLSAGVMLGPEPLLPGSVGDVPVWLPDPDDPDFQPGDDAWPILRTDTPDVVVEPAAGVMVVWQSLRTRRRPADPWGPWSDAQVFEGLIDADRRDTTGLEVVRGEAEISRQRGVFIVRAEALEALVGASIEAFRVKDWQLYLAHGRAADGTDSAGWDLVSAGESWERGRFVDLVAERRE